jgi:hypothetical protein
MDTMMILPVTMGSNVDLMTPTTHLDMATTWMGGITIEYH